MRARGIRRPARGGDADQSKWWNCGHTTRHEARLSPDDHDRLDVVGRLRHLGERVVAAAHRDTARAEAIDRARLAVVRRDDGVRIRVAHRGIHLRDVPLPPDLVADAELIAPMPAAPSRFTGRTGNANTAHTAALSARPAHSVLRRARVRVHSATGTAPIAVSTASTPSV